MSTSDHAKAAPQLRLPPLTVGQLARYAPFIALVALVIVGATASSTFITSGNIKAVLLSSAILMIVAVGQTFVISTAGIDLSVASVAQLSAVLLGQALSHGWSLWSAVLASVAAGALAGVVNGLLVAKGKIGDFIVTLGTAAAIQGLTLLISQAQPVVVAEAPLIRLSVGSVGPFSYMLLVALVVAGIGWYVLFATPFGTHVLAVGGNRKGAAAMGVRTDTVKIAVYAISGTAAAIGGILLTARLGSAEPTAGAEYQLTSVAAAVLGGVSLFGGRSSIFGPVVGAVILTGILNLLNITSVSVYYQPIALGVVVVLSALLRRFEPA
jgi:ribose/xylose/arabinose/galactoside ABC-type transport system permease subunit